MRSLNSSPIAAALVSTIRLLSRSQAAHLFQCHPASAERKLKSLSIAGSVLRLGGLMVPKVNIPVPLLQHSEGQTGIEQSLDGIAYELKSRRQKRKVYESLWGATTQSQRTAGLNPKQPPSRRSDWEHDLGVTNVWLTLREEIEVGDGTWILEDHFPELLPKNICKPDALIQWADNSIELIEYGGCYSAETLETKFESWHDFKWRLY